MFKKEALFFTIKFIMLSIIEILVELGICYYLALYHPYLFILFFAGQFIYITVSTRRIKNPKKYCKKDCNTYDDCKYWNCEEYDKKRWLI